jgi:hypothetical protein
MGVNLLGVNAKWLCVEFCCAVRCKKKTTWTRHHQNARQIRNIQKASKSTENVEKIKIFENDKNGAEMNSK